MGVEVVNRYHLKEHTPGDVNIQRGTPLGNPYRIGTMTRPEVIAMYRQYLKERMEKNDTEIVAMIYQLVRRHECGEDLRLICSCKPFACHGDVVREVVLELSCT